MMSLFDQMMKWPMDMMAAGMQMMGGMSGMPGMAPGGGSPMGAGGAAKPMAPPATGAAPTWGGGKAASSKKEARTMSSHDLGGDDLKYVRYSILFTKADYEASLLDGARDLVDYPADAASWSATKIARFMGDAARGKVPRPQAWVDRNYPPGAGSGGWEIPVKDDRYVRFVFEVEQRLPKSDPDYEKQRVEAIREISAKIG